MSSERDIESNRESNEKSCFSLKNGLLAVGSLATVAVLLGVSYHVLWERGESEGLSNANGLESQSTAETEDDQSLTWPWNNENHSEFGSEVEIDYSSDGSQVLPPPSKPKSTNFRDRNRRTQNVSDIDSKIESFFSFLKGFKSKEQKDSEIAASLPSSSNPFSNQFETSQSTSINPYEFNPNDLDLPLADMSDYEVETNPRDSSQHSEFNSRALVLEHTASENMDQESEFNRRARSIGIPSQTSTSTRAVPNVFGFHEEDPETEEEEVENTNLSTGANYSEGINPSRNAEFFEEEELVSEAKIYPQFTAKSSLSSNSSRSIENVVKEVEIRESSDNETRYSEYSEFDATETEAKLKDPALNMPQSSSPYAFRNGNYADLVGFQSEEQSRPSAKFSSQFDEESLPPSTYSEESNPRDHPSHSSHPLTLNETGDHANVVGIYYPYDLTYQPYDLTYQPNAGTYGHYEEESLPADVIRSDQYEEESLPAVAKKFNQYDEESLPADVENKASEAGVKKLKGAADYSEVSMDGSAKGSKNKTQLLAQPPSLNNPCNNSDASPKDSDEESCNSEISELTDDFGDHDDVEEDDQEIFINESEDDFSIKKRIWPQISFSKSPSHVQDATNLPLEEHKDASEVSIAAYSEVSEPHEDSNNEENVFKVAKSDVPIKQQVYDEVNKADTKDSEDEDFPQVQSTHEGMSPVPRGQNLIPFQIGTRIRVLDPNDPNLVGEHIFTLSTRGRAKPQLSKDKTRLYYDVIENLTKVKAFNIDSKSSIPVDFPKMVETHYLLRKPDLNTAIYTVRTESNNWLIRQYNLETQEVILDHPHKCGKNMPIVRTQSADGSRLIYQCHLSNDFYMKNMNYTREQDRKLSTMLCSYDFAPLLSPDNSKLIVKKDKYDDFLIIINRNAQKTWQPIYFKSGIKYFINVSLSDDNRTLYIIRMDAVETPIEYYLHEIDFASLFTNNYSDKRNPLDIGNGRRIKIEANFSSHSLVPAGNSNLVVFRHDSSEVHLINLNDSIFRSQHLFAQNVKYPEDPQISKDQKQIYFQNKVAKVFDLETGLITEAPFPGDQDSGFMLVKPDLASVVYVIKDEAGQRLIRHYNIERSEIIADYPHKCGDDQPVIWTQFNDGSKILYRCLRSKDVYLKNLIDPADQDDTLLFNTTRLGVSNFKALPSPDNSKLILFGGITRHWIVIDLTSENPIKNRKYVHFNVSAKFLHPCHLSEDNMTLYATYWDLHTNELIREPPAICKINFNNLFDENYPYDSHMNLDFKDGYIDIEPATID